MKRSTPFTFLGLLFVLPMVVAIAEPWRQYIFSPESRNPAPAAVHSATEGASVQTLQNGHILRMPAGSQVAMDFGVEVGGWVSFQVRSNATTPLRLAFSESPLFVRNISDDTGASPFMDWDQALEVTVTPDRCGKSFYQTSKERFRGGFRFLTFNAIADVIVHNITCQIGFAPNMPDLRSGSGFFYTADPNADILNRIWYAGAYTVQTNMVPTDTGRYLPQVRPGWAYNATLGVASPALVDGAKRDRAIWPGDMGVSGPAAMLAFGVQGREVFHNSLETLFYYQNASTGLLPFAGPATGSFRSGAKSDPYHTWGLIAMHDYALYSGDGEWLAKHWDNITKAVEYIVGGLDNAIGLQEVVNANDWGRRGTSGFNTALNALAYHALVSMASLSPRQAQADSWRAVAERLKSGFNSFLWDEDAGLYRDNTTTGLHPQDGNALAMLYNLTKTPSQASIISQALEAKWNDIGPVSPELPDNISPFISGLEALGHLHVGEVDRAMELTRRLWGFLLTNNSMTGSTFAEGLTSNGSLYYRSEDGYKYDAAYTSLSHSWSVAPTVALSTLVTGLRITGLGGRTWELKPMLGDLKSARTGFETGMGWFEANVEVEDGDVHIEMVAPIGTQGTIVLGMNQNVVINGRTYKGTRDGIQAAGTGSSVLIL